MACFKHVCRIKRNIGLLVLCIGICVQYAATDLITNTNWQNWWDARRSCQTLSNGDLFIPKSFPISYNLLFSLRSGFYWIGAMEQRSWKWIKEERNLFAHKGQYSIPLLTPYSRIPGNSVYACHRGCHGFKMIGLSGTRCYCLSWQGMMMSEHSEVVCPGNFEEKCGSIKGISVYKLDGVLLDSSHDGVCVYAKKRWIRKLQRVTLVPSSCDQTYFSACYGQSNQTGCYENHFYKCRGNVCTTCYAGTWNNSNQRCHLVAISDANKINVLKVMDWNIRYWVGLRMYFSRMWINGTDFQGVNFPVWEDQTCLALWVYNTSYELHWLDCHAKVQSVCEISMPDPATSTAESSTSGVPATTIIDNLTEMMNVSGNQLEGDTNSQRGYDQIGIYIGSSVGGVIFLTLLIVLVIFQRQGKVCFKRTDNGHTVHFTTTADNVTYDLGTVTGISPIIASHPGITGNNNTEVETPVLHNGHEVNANISDLNLSSGTYSQVPLSAEKCKGSPVYLENGSVTHTAECLDSAYDRARQRKSLKSSDGCYNHIGNIEVDYDVTSRCHLRSRMDDTYNHLHETENQRDNSTIRHSSLKLNEVCDKNTGEEADYYNISPQTNCDESYYNVGHFSELQNDENSPGQKQDEETTYTLAKEMSYI